MANDLSEAKAGARSILHHASDKILELVRVVACTLTLFMVVPEFIRSGIHDPLVVHVLRNRLIEGDGGRAHHEKDNSDTEHVVVNGVVALASVHLRGHVSRGSFVAFGNTAIVMASRIDGKAEVNDLEISVDIEHKILWLQVAMCNTISVHVVDCLQKLFEVVAADFLWEGTSVSDIIEEFSAGNLFLHDIGNSFRLLAVHLKLRALFRFHAAHHVFVNQPRGCVELLEHVLQCLLTCPRVAMVKNLDGYFLAIRAGGRVHLRSEAFAKLIVDNVLVKLSSLSHYEVCFVGYLSCLDSIIILDTTSPFIRLEFDAKWYI